MTHARHGQEFRFTGKGICRWCGTTVKPPKRRWCSQECVDEYRIRNGDGGLIRSLVLKRDRGVCGACGLDTVKLQRVMRDLKDRAEGYRWAGKRYHRERKIQTPRPDWLAALYQKYPWTVRRYESFWEADHIIPVSEGGGNCGLENYRTLCVGCHRIETKKLAKRLADKRKGCEQLELFRRTV